MNLWKRFLILFPGSSGWGRLPTARARAMVNLTDDSRELEAIALAQHTHAALGSTRVTLSSRYLRLAPSSRSSCNSSSSTHSVSRR